MRLNELGKDEVLTSSQWSFIIEMGFSFSTVGLRLLGPVMWRGDHVLELIMGLVGGHGHAQAMKVWMKGTLHFSVP